MAEIVVSDFSGIAPRIKKASPGEVTYAKTAINVDFRSGVLCPLKANSLEEYAHSGEIIKFNGVWHSGNSNYLKWKIDDYPVLFYKKTGNWYRVIDGVERSLGCNRPDVATLSDISLHKPSSITGTVVLDDVNYLEYSDYKYYVTYSMFVDGVELESFPSEALSVLDYSEDNASPRIKMQINRPSIYNPNVTKWNLYRSDSEDTARLIGTGEYSGFGENLSYITDFKASNERGRSVYSINSNREIKYQFGYIITWVRGSGRYEDESGPSSPVTIEIPALGVNVFRPSSVPSGVTSWKIYRISLGYDATVAYNLVVELPIATTSYEDVKTNLDIVYEDTLPTMYTGSDGTLITLTEPDINFDGMSGPFMGCMVGWKGTKLLFSETGKPDLYSPAFTYTAAANIVNVLAVGADLYILTENGIQRLVGSTPESMQILPEITGEGAYSRLSSVSTERGIFYLSEGRISHRGDTYTGITDLIGTAYFKDLFSNYSDFHMNYSDNILYLFHSGGALCYDFKASKWYNLDSIYTSSFYDKETSEMYIVEDGNIMKLFGSDDCLIMQYKSGELVLSKPADKKFNRFVFTGTGTILSKLYLAGTLQVSQTMDLDGMNYEKIIKMPQGYAARSAQFEVFGTGEVTEVAADVFRVRK